MKKYWKSLEERKQEPGKARAGQEHEVLAKQEIIDFLEKGGDQIRPGRRDFLKFCGFGVATAAVVSSCKNPVNKAIPYLVKPEDVNPGESEYYATSFFDGRDLGNLVVKARDGRPVKIEGNDKCPVMQGGTTARLQASLYSLYDQATRLKAARINGKDCSMDDLDRDITARLEQAAAQGKKTALLTATIISPGILAAIESLKTRHPGLYHITYDALSFSGIRLAHKVAFGQDGIPSCHFDKAKVIVGVNCDFLGNWLSPVEYSRQYATARRMSGNKPEMALHYQVESCLSLTGSNADVRIPLKPSEEGGFLKALYNYLLTEYGNPADHSHRINPAEIGEALLRHRGQSLVVSGSNSPEIQILVAGINHLLGNYGSTLTFGDQLLTGRGDDAAVGKLLRDIESGDTTGLILYQVNPVYDHFEGERFLTALKKLNFSLSSSPYSNETTAGCSHLCPDDHYLEAWGDHHPKENLYSLAQPLIPRLFNTRSFLESLLKWSGDTSDAQAFIRSHWEKHCYPRQERFQSFESFWVNSLQEGVFTLPAAEPTFSLSEETMARAGSNIPADGKGYEVALYESIGLGDGRQTNNPWLLELPDPVSKVCWDNYAALSPATAKALNVTQGDLLKIGDKLVLPVLLQPGQAASTVGIALGFGRTEAGKAGSGVGKNAWPLVSLTGDCFSYSLDNVMLAKEAGTHVFAQTQMHHSMEGRPIIRETTLDAYSKDPAAGNEMHEKIEKHHVTLYPEQEFPVHHWGMAIDFNACTGCSSCVVGCQAENNIPVIGKEEVGKKRLMHWIRVDRYYSGDEENPEVLFQPLMCQHCDHAPCENVCPVAATTHSNEGLNQMAYNRCIGTKYCINNCPYKVRRFNWFRYNDNPEFAFGTENALGKMLLNPDVTVRERGVVEKCSLCVQRIQEGKLKAKKEGRLLKDGEITPACAQACPSKAIVFGDLNDPESEVSKLFRNPRNYYLLEELHTLPSVGYLTKVSHRAGNTEDQHSH